MKTLRGEDRDKWQGPVPCPSSTLPQHAFSAVSLEEFLLRMWGGPRDPLPDGWGGTPLTEAEKARSRKF